MPLGYEQVVGERGMGLSGGQIQRLCIARALYHDPRLLVFDEATSALDTQSESNIMANMDDILKGRTAVIIAHRLSTIMRADKILVLYEGKIVEQGRHEELVRAPRHVLRAGAKAVERRHMKILDQDLGRQLHALVRGADREDRDPALDAALGVQAGAAGHREAAAPGQRAARRGDAALAQGALREGGRCRAGAHRACRGASVARRLIERSFVFEGTFGDNPKLLEALEIAEKAAPTGLPVLIDGESGTGKELMAKVIHANGDRADRPFISVNCGAIPENLLESELFGHRKGSFTGARRATARASSRARTPAPSSSTRSANCRCPAR